MKKKSLTLYGMAVAAMPRHDGSGMIDVVCNTLAVSADKPDAFEMVKELSFKTALDASKPGALMECFSRVVDTLGEVVKREEQATAECGVAYRPVCFYLGDAGKNKVNLDALFMEMFGDRFFRPVTPSEIRDAVHANFAERNAEMEINPQMIPLLARGEVEEEVEKYKASEAELRKAQKARKALGADAVPEAYAQACKKLAGLLEKCTLDRGRISSNVDGRAVEQSETDREILSLRKARDGGDASAHEALAGLAEKIGRAWGEKVNQNPYTFVLAAPPGYRENKAMQEKFPRFAFFHDHPDYKAAFHRGYKQTCKDPYNHTQKLPLDPPDPLYATPLADRMRDQIEIAMGTRAEEVHFDIPEVRQKLMRAAARIGEGKAWPDAIQKKKPGERGAAAERG